MSAGVAYDAASLAGLAFIALSIVSAVLVAAWWRGSLRHRAPGQRLQALAALTLFLCFDLVCFGAYTRLSDSGLGCPDWPGCYATASPVAAATSIAAAEAAAPEGPVTERKAWIEMIHRYFAMALGVLIILLLAAALAARHERPAAWRWALLTLAWVVMQGVFGALTVTWKLYPAVVTAHLLGGMGLLALLAVQAWPSAGMPGVLPGMARADPAATSRAGDRSVAPAMVTGEPRPPAFGGTAISTATSGRDRAALAATSGRDRAAPAATSARDSAALAFATLALLAQIALGGWVSTNYAVLACTGFPTCNGRWWPAMDWGDGFTLLRELGRRADGQWIPMSALVAIQMAHRLFAIVAAGALGWLALRLARGGAAAQRRGALVAALLVLQWATGLSNVVLGWPLAAALLHTAGAAALVVCLGREAALARAARRRCHDAPRAAPDATVPRPLT